MSVSSSALASISTDLRSGWGALAIGAEASRLSENDLRTARSSGEPGRAMKVVCAPAAGCCRRPCGTARRIPRRSYTKGPHQAGEQHLLADAATRVDRQEERLVEQVRRISIQVLSSFCHSGNRPSICFASLTTSAKGLGAPAAGGGAGGVAAGRACAGAVPGAAVATAGVGAAVGMADTEVAAGAAFVAGVVAQADSSARSERLASPRPVDESRI